MQSNHLETATDGPVILELVSGCLADTPRPLSDAAQLQLEVDHRLAQAAGTLGNDFGLAFGYWLIVVPTLAGVAFCAALYTPLGFLPGCVGLTYVLIYRRLRRDRTAALLALPEFDTRWLGPLLNATAWPDAALRLTVHAKLRQLMPHLRREDGEALTPQQRARFHQLLGSSRDPDLRVALLQGAEWIGDRDTVDVLETISTRRALSPGARRIRRAARVCLPKLKASLREREAAAAPLVRDAGTATPELVALSDADTAGPSTLTEQEELMALIRGYEAEGRKRSAGMRMGFLIADWIVIVPYTAIRTGLAATHHAPLMATVWATAALAASQLHRFSLSYGQAERARRIAEFVQPECVGPMAAMLEAPDTVNQEIARASLVKLLPRLHSSDAGLLDPAQRACLYRALRPQQAKQHVDLTLSILKSLEQIGDDNAIDAVTRLASDVPLTGEAEKIRQAARECLVYLPQRAMYTRNSRQLLRASAQEAVSPTSLLRHARESDTQDEMHLLRPGSGSV